MTGTTASPTFPAPSHAMHSYSTPLTSPGLPTTSPHPTDLTVRTPDAVRRRPSVRAAWYWENRKAPNRWYWGAVTALCTLASLSGYLQYRPHQSEFQARGSTWDIIWPQSTLVLSMWLLPLVMSGFAAQITTGEHQGDNWQRMRANRLETAMVNTTILILTTAVTGLVAGFSLLGLTAYFPRFGATVLGMWGILTFVTWLGTMVRSFATTMITVTLGAIVGTAMLLTAQPLSVLNPMTALIRATASLKPEAMTSPGAAAVDSLINLAWVTVFAISLLQTVRRR